MNLDRKQRIEQHLKALVPLKSVKGVEALEAAGELALPYLHPRLQYAAEIAAACVRCLIHIGDEAALEGLEAEAELAVSTRSAPPNEAMQPTSTLASGARLRARG